MSSPEPEKVAQVQRAVRAWGDMKDLIVVLSKKRAGQPVDEPRLKTREGRYLYQVFLSPVYGLPTTGRASDIARLDDDVQKDLAHVQGTEYDVLPESQEAYAPLLHVGDIAAQIINVSQQFAQGKLLPTHPAYDALCAIVRAHADLFKERRLPDNNVVEQAYRARRPNETT